MSSRVAVLTEGAFNHAPQTKAVKMWDRVQSSSSAQPKKHLHR